MEDVQHHALAGLGLLGESLCPLHHPGVQFPGQLLGAVELEGKAAAHKRHAAQRKGNIEHPGAAQQVKRVALREKRKDGQQRPHPEPGGHGAGKKQQPRRLIAAAVSRKKQVQAQAHPRRQHSKAEGRQTDLPQKQEDGRCGHDPFGGQRQSQQRCREQGGGQDRYGEEQPHEPLCQPLKAAGETGHQTTPEDENDEIEQKILQLRPFFVMAER